MDLETTLAKLRETQTEKSEIVDLASALRALVDRPFLQGERHKLQHSRANRVGAHPDILEFEKSFLARMRRLGVPMFVSELNRDLQRQNELYVKGFSNATYGKSAHNFGCAVDVVHGRLGWELEPQSWSMLGHIGKEVALQRGIKIVWGGDFKSLYDPAHWELANWRSLKTEFPFTRQADPEATK